MIIIVFFKRDNIIYTNYQYSHAKLVTFILKHILSGETKTKLSFGLSIPLINW